MHKISYLTTAFLPFYFTIQSVALSELKSPNFLDYSLESNALNYTQFSSFVPHYSSDNLRAIVQLQGLNLPQPNATGQGDFALSFLAGSRVFTLDLEMGEVTGQFLLDTGASTSMLSSKIVQELGLQGQSLPPELLTSAVAGEDCKTMNANLHQFPPLTSNLLRIEGVQGLEFTDVVIPEGLSGVLGMDILSHYDLLIHPQRQELKLLPPHSNPTLSEENAIPLTEKLGVLLVELEINGQGPFKFLIDTGADRIFISQELGQLLNISEVNRSPIQIQGFCGLEPAEATFLKQVQLQNYQQNDLEAIILSSPVLDLLEIDGILGQNFLNQYIQYWWFSRNIQDGKLTGGKLFLLPLSTSDPRQN